MVEIWILHILFMSVFFGFPAFLGFRQYREWRKMNNSSLIKRFKKDLGMNF